MAKRKFLTEMELVVPWQALIELIEPLTRWRADPGGRSPHATAVLQQPTEQGADFLLTVKANQRTLNRQISHQLRGKRKIPFLATNHETAQGRDINWTCGQKRLLITSRKTGMAPTALPSDRQRQPGRQAVEGLASLADESAQNSRRLGALVRERWSLESWHWITSLIWSTTALQWRLTPALSW